MQEIMIIEEKPAGQQLLKLKKAVGWGKQNAQDIQPGLDGSLFHARPNDSEGAGMVQPWRIV
jgi:hypothetical protein